MKKLPAPRLDERRAPEFRAELEDRARAWIAAWGLDEGERVVTRGGFLIDSQFQITGQPSLFYPGGVAAGAGGHRHNTEGSTGDSAPPPPPSSSGHLH